MENKNNDKEKEDEVKEPAVKYGHITPAEFLEMINDGENRLEYYNGHVVESGAVSWEHDTIENNLSFKLREFLNGKGCEVMGPNMPVGIASGKSFMLPDRLIICEKMILDLKFRCLLNPSVIFEVLSPSTRDMDEGIKLERYKMIPSIREYIMIDSQKKKIIALRKQPDDNWGPEEIITGNNNLLIKTIGYQLPLPEIYRHTGL